MLLIDFEADKNPTKAAGFVVTDRLTFLSNGLLNS